MSIVCTTTGTYPYDRNVTVLWVPTIANIYAPTAAEIAAGIDLRDTYNMTQIMGWQIVTAPVGGTWGPFDRKRMGKQSIGETQLEFAAQLSQGVNDIRSLWARGENGFIIILPSGEYLNYPNAPVNVYPVRVAQLTQRQGVRATGASLILVSFVVTLPCGENVFIVP